MNRSCAPASIGRRGSGDIRYIGGTVRPELSGLTAAENPR
ncbi:hypothetical protein LC55x_2577 [Lysobacter capsici]|nr:hypothetical protein LC55x_2577 [Lysobacter capsici]